MSYLPGQTPLWPITPDWSNSVKETLAWLTDIIRARNGRAQKRELRRSPRRSLDFSVVYEGQDRRILDNLLQANGGSYWWLPMWHDVQQLDADLPLGSLVVPCRTTGFDFAVGGKVLLRASVTDWELLTIDSFDGAGLTFTTTTSQDFSAGTALYPVRLAFLDEQPEDTIWTDRAGTRNVRFRVEPPNDWGAIGPTESYLGYTVLSVRPDWSEAPKRTFDRTLDTIDVDTGPISVFDFPGRAFTKLKQRWIAYGRDENTEMRSLLYFLRGRMATLWVPTWQSDFLMTDSMTAVATDMEVEWSGYSLFPLPAQWRDIRIELVTGQVFYRRITDVTDNGTTELLTLDSALGVAVDPADVLLISFIVLAEGSSDTMELNHPVDADGLTELTIGFNGVRHDI